ncbi:MAG: hypothetical protein WCC85_13405, partial [Candidatus Sulfotelmatobacter sp.]
MDAVFEIFKARAEAVNAEVHHFPQKNEALAFILNYLNDTGVRDLTQAYAVWASCPFLEGLDQGQISASVPGLIFDAT